MRRSNRGASVYFLMTFAYAGIAIVAIGSSIFAGARALFSADSLGEDIRQLLLNKMPVIVGLPAAAMTAFLVVALLKQASGPIEFEGAGFKFRGASGQVVLWLLCFIVIAAMIKWLW